MNFKTADTPSTDLAEPAAIARRSRRRFVREVGIVVPVILTVGSRSALASTCLSPSARASINLLHSRPGRPGEGTCAGRSPGYWKHQNSELVTTKFGLFFPDNSPASFSEKTMKEVVGLRGDANYAALARHLAAAWCNMNQGLVSILSLGDLTRMWNGRIGGYAPLPSQPTLTWNEAQIVDYLKTTMI